MPGTTSTALPSFSHDQNHETDAAKRKGGVIFRTCAQSSSILLPTLLSPTANFYLFFASF